MDIYYKYKRLQKACNSVQESNKVWGPELAKKLHQRLFELKAADSLEDISYLRPARLHELEGTMKGKFAVDLKQPFRLIFEPCHNPVPLKNDGGIDRNQVTAILVLEVGDYH